MKTKHLQKIFISSVYAMLISVVFFLLPLSAKAQGSITVECTTPQTPDIELICSGEEVAVTVTITNVGATSEVDIVAKITPEAGLEEKGYTVAPVGAIEYDAILDLWTIDEIAAGETVTLVLTYMATNTGPVSVVLTHSVEITIIDSSPVSGIGDEVYIKVFPTPHLDPVTNKAYCSNTAIAEFEFSGSLPGANYQWTKIGGDDIGTPPSGTGSIPPFTTIENTTDHLITAYYHVVVSYNYPEILCGGETQEFSISVMPEPVVTNLKDFVYCNAAPADIPMFEGVATTWKWEKIDGQDVGVPGNSGEGPFPSFFAKNLGDTPLTALYAVTPYYETENVSCKGEPGYFAITVNPQPYLNTVPAEMVYCNKTQAPAYNFSGTVGAVHHWEFVSGDPINGVPNSGTGPFPGFVALNDTDDMITTTFKAWAEYKNSDGSTCASDEKTFKIIVLPTATIDLNALSTELCHNEYVPAQHFASNIPGTSLLYVQNEWKYVGGDNIGLEPVYGVNTIPSFYAKNSGNTPLVAQYQVTAFVEYNGILCEGVTYNFPITVYPLGGIMLTNSSYDACDYEESVDIAYTTTQVGMDMEYTLTFLGVAPSAGFQDVPNFTDLPKDFFTITLPNDVPAGVYEATLAVRAKVANIDNCTTDYTVKIDVKQYIAITAEFEFGGQVAVCDDSELTLTVNVTPANASVIYTWYRNGSQIIGANANTYSKFPVTSSDEGDYYVVVTGDNICGEAITGVAHVTVNQALIAQKWNDVLYVDDASYSTYQWCRVLEDGTRDAITGATAQYYSEQPLHGSYVVRLIDNAGYVIAESCEFTPTIITKNTIIYPNPIAGGATLTIAMDMDPEQISGSRIDVYDVLGNLNRTTAVDGKPAQVTMSVIPGTYIVRITNASGETLKSEKVLVQ